MGLYEKFETNKDHETKGIEIDYGDGIVIRVARAGGANKRFIKASEQFYRKYKRKIDLNILPNDVAYESVIDMYASTVVLSWEGVTDREGNDLPCTKENVKKLFQDLPDLFTDVRDAASSHELFREHVNEQDAGN